MIINKGRPLQIGRAFRLFLLYLNIFSSNPTYKPIFNLYIFDFEPFTFIVIEEADQKSATHLDSFFDTKIGNGNT
ncbi:hypothetical protein C6X95_04545 [Bacillus pumilus]|nr:hypothetical protein C6X95_04545 [Bacillus pumilus]